MSNLCKASFKVCQGLRFVSFLFSFSFHLFMFEFVKSACIAASSAFHRGPMNRPVERLTLRSSCLASDSFKLQRMLNPIYRATVSNRKTLGAVRGRLEYTMSYSIQDLNLSSGNVYFSVLREFPFGATSMALVDTGVATSATLSISCTCCCNALTSNRA